MGSLGFRGKKLLRIHHTLVLTDLITLEKLQRMEQARLRSDETEDLQSYFYEPEGLLSSVLGRLTCVSPP